jgi:phosphocarrier protein NPr
MSLLMLGAGKGTTLRLVLDGADEEQALSEIQALFAAKFYEVKKIKGNLKFSGVAAKY